MRSSYRPPGNASTRPEAGGVFIRIVETNRVNRAKLPPVAENFDSIDVDGPYGHYDRL